MSKIPLVFSLILGVVGAGYFTSIPQEIPGAPPTITKESDPFEYRVFIEFLVHAEEANANPVLHTEFLRALDEWRKKIPIFPVIYIDTQMLRDTENKILLRPGMHVVRYSELDNDNKLGMFSRENRMIIFNSKAIKEDAIIGYNTAVHELGHMFGVPHICGQAETGWLSTGDIVLNTPNNFGPNIMFPFIVNKETRNTISVVEAKIATNYILNFRGFMK